jgi:hypothetical protein
VIANQATVIGCRPARIARHSAFVNPCASMIASVAPSGEPASKRSAWRCSTFTAIAPGQALALWLFLPEAPLIRPNSPLA